LGGDAAPPHNIEEPAMRRHKVTPSAAIAVSSALFLFTALAATASAQSMHNLDRLADAEPYSSQYQGKGALWIVYQNPDTGNYILASAVRINKHWGIGVAHSFLQGKTFRTGHIIGDGRNYATDWGEERIVTEFHLHPDYNPNDPFRYGSIDLVVFRWDEPLPGEDLTIAPLTIDEVFTYAGFGRPATPATGYLPSDRERRAFDAGAHGWGALSGSLSTDYVRSSFYWSGHSQWLSMGGVVTSGNSGSGGFNAAGELVAIAAAQGGAPDIGATTFGVRTSRFKDWIEQLTHIPSPDLTGDGAVGSADLAILLSNWGPCPQSGVCAADLDRDGHVGSSDLANLLSQWGPLPDDPPRSRAEPAPRPQRPTIVEPQPMPTLTAPLPEDAADGRSHTWPTR